MKNDQTDLPAKIDHRVDMVCSHVTYEIATGVFLPNTRLPAVRDAAKRWRVDHRIVLKAYQKLERMGLVRSVPRSGYFVAIGDPHDQVSRHRFELEAMFDRLAVEITDTTELSVLGAFRYLSELAEIRARTKPECLFVECTKIQSEGHAVEVTNRLAIPCQPMTINQIDGKESRIPMHVRTVLVTGFHYSELRKLGRSKRLNVYSVPIEVSPEQVPSETRQEETIVFESDETQAQHMVQDLESLKLSRVCRLEVTSDINASLETLFRISKRKKNLRALLSPRLWGQLEKRWQDHARVSLIQFRIVESAWSGIADALALPLGAISSSRI